MRLILTLLVLVAGSAYGQLQKGSFMIGGNMGVNSIKAPTFSQLKGEVEDMTSTSWNVSPTIRYFIIDNLAAGLSFSISGSKTKAADGKGKSSGIDAGPTVRYYFPFGKFAVFPSVSATWGKTNSDYTYSPGLGYPTQKSTWKSNKYTAGVGVAWFVANNVAVEGLLFYQSMDAGLSTADLNTQKTVGFNIGIQFFIPSNKD